MQSEAMALLSGSKQGESPSRRFADNSGKTAGPAKKPPDSREVSNAVPLLTVHRGQLAEKPGDLHGVPHGVAAKRADAAGVQSGGNPVERCDAAGADVPDQVLGSKTAVTTRVRWVG